MKLSKRYLVVMAFVIIASLVLASVAAASGGHHIGFGLKCKDDYVKAWGWAKGSDDIYVYDLAGHERFHTTSDGFGTTFDSHYHTGPWTMEAVYFWGSKFLTEGCDLNAGAPPDEDTGWTYSVDNLGDTTNYVNDGVEACGVFDVVSFGVKTVEMSEYPDCTGDVMVLCLDGEGNWTGENISNFSQAGGVVQFTSGQFGTCAFFPVAAP
jgi:hypothetical protein